MNMMKNPELHNQASPVELKSRLINGEPGLTIIDVRNPDQFRDCRIMGAVNMPTESMLQMVSKLEPTRDIYVYSGSDEETAEAANSLRQAGFQRVAELKGGIEAWSQIGGPLEGISTNENQPSPDNFSVFARLQKHAEERAKEKSMQ